MLLCSHAGGYNCLDDSPIPGDPRYGYSNQWNTGMCEAPCADPCCFLGAIVCTCPAVYWMRYEVLDKDMRRYACCQGYYDCCCFKAGSMGEDSCPEMCLCLEAWLCEPCSISASRMAIMDTRNIMPDPCDSRLIRLNNCLLLLSCICHILAIFDDSFSALADLVELISDIVYAIVSACMITQTHVEVTKAPKPVDWNRMNMFPKSGSKGMRQGQNFQAPPPIPQQAQMGGHQGGGGKACPQCRTPVSPGERFCSNCGSGV